MAGSITSFFASLFPSSKPPQSPQPTRLASNTRAVGSTAPTATSVSSTSASAGTSRDGSSNSSPDTAVPPAIASRQQVRDQRAQFLDKLSKGSARKGKRMGKKTAGHGRPSMQTPPPS